MTSVCSQDQFQYISVGKYSHMQIHRQLLLKFMEGNTVAVVDTLIPMKQSSVLLDTSHYNGHKG